MTVTYFRQRVPGPEADLEDAVAIHVGRLCPAYQHSRWVGGSLPIGAGRPDLVIALYEPEVIALAHAELSAVHILAYLRAVKQARLETISNRVGATENLLVSHLDELVQAEVLTAKAATYSLRPCWREILPEIVTVEAKVSDWQGAVEQAARNRVFAHRSFIALPEPVAKRIRRESIFSRTGLGILAVDVHHDVRVVRRAAKGQPRVWWYYYQVALVVAQELGGRTHAVRRTA